MAENEKFITELRKQVIDSENELDGILKEIERARRIGMDVSNLLEQHKNLKSQIELTKTVYKLE